MSLFDIRDREAAFLDRCQEIEYVTARRWRRVEFDALFVDILGIFFALVEHIKVNRFLIFVVRDKILAHRAGLQYAFVAVDKQRPWIIRVWRSSPGAMLPIQIVFVVFEAGALGVADV